MVRFPNTNKKHICRPRQAANRTNKVCTVSINALICRPFMLKLVALLFGRFLFPMTAALCACVAVFAWLLFRPSISWSKCVVGSWEDLKALEEESGGASGDATALLKPWRVSRPFAFAHTRRLANASPFDVGVARTLAKRNNPAMAAEPATHADSHATELGAIAAPARQPHRKLRRSRLLEGDPNARAKREASQREIWLPKLHALIHATGLPFVHIASHSQSPSAVVCLDWSSEACIHHSQACA